MAIGAAALLVAGAVALDRGERRQAPSPERTDRAPSRTSAAQADSPDHSASVLRAASYVLPPQDVPLADVLPGLEAAARAGNLQAKCRLAFELRRCGSERAWLRDYYEEIADRVLYADEPALDHSLREHARGEQQMAEYERICRGVSAPPDLRPWRLWHDAARAGHVPSMLRFASGVPGGMHGGNQDLEVLATWRDESIGFLQRAAEAGDGWAAYQLFWGYAGNAGFPTYHVQDDRKALVYALALRGAGDAPTAKNLTEGAARLRRRLPATDVHAAELEAARLAARFAHLVGAEVDLRGPQDKAAEDCAYPDPRTRPLSPSHFGAAQ
jgi:hypothetical protein